MDNGMRLQRHLISFELKNTYVGNMPFSYPYIFVDMCSYILIEEKDVVNKLVKTRRLIQEQDIETIPREVIKLKIDEAIFGRRHIDLLIDNVVRFFIVRFVLCASSSFYVVPFGPSVYWIITKTHSGTRH
jgi:hypothetical protein